MRATIVAATMRNVLLLFLSLWLTAAAADTFYPLPDWSERPDPAAAPEEAFMAGTLFNDDEAERDTDYYYVRVRERNGQWGFSSPIWVER